MSDALPQPTATLVRRLRRVARWHRNLGALAPERPAAGDVNGAAEYARANTCDQAAGRLEDLETDLAELSAPAPGFVFVYRGRPLEQLTRDELLAACSSAWAQIDLLRRVIGCDQATAQAFTEAAEGKLRP